MNETIGAADIYERAKIRQADHMTRTYFPNLKFGNKAFLHHITRFACRCPFRKDEPVPTAIDFDHFHGDGLVHHTAPTVIRGLTLGSAAAGDTHLGGGDKAAQVSDFYDQTALVVPSDRPFEYFP